jgi:hypothetical protein
MNRRFGDLFPELHFLMKDHADDQVTRLVLHRAKWQCYYDIRISPLVEQEGASQGYFVTLHDVTGLQLAEDEFRKRVRFITKLDNLGRATDDAQAMLHSSAVWLSTLLDADGAAIILWNEDQRAIQTIAAHGLLTDWKSLAKAFSH